MASEPAMSDLNLVLRLVSTERIVPDAILEAEARISDLQFRNARLVQNVMQLEATIRSLRCDIRVAARGRMWDCIGYDSTPEDSP